MFHVNVMYPVRSYLPDLMLALINKINSSSSSKHLNTCGSMNRLEDSSHEVTSWWKEPSGYIILPFSGSQHYTEEAGGVNTLHKNIVNTSKPVN